MTFKCIFEVNDQVFETKFGEYLSLANSTGVYKGNYEITPKAFRSQILKTADKLLEKNIKVLEIPYYETSNTKGTTVFIGGD